jgi:hypothetical protein
MGRANLEAIELTRRHCRNARIELVGGNSPVGSMYGLPMGLLEVRCEHAPPPRAQGHQALELAMDFYDANCIDCPFRRPSGELPSLATVAGERAAEKVAHEAAAQLAAEERARRHQLRREPPPNRHWAIQQYTPPASPVRRTDIMGGCCAAYCCATPFGTSVLSPRQDVVR